MKKRRTKKTASWLKARLVYLKNPTAENRSAMKKLSRAAIAEIRSL